MNINHDTGTVEIPYDQYLRAVEDHCNKMIAESDRETPRARELKAKITPVIEMIKSANIAFDEKSLASNPRAVELKAELDQHLPEFLKLEASARERIERTHYFKQRVKSFQGQNTVTVGVPEAVILLDLEDILPL